jgi:hypothetical protein
MHPRLHNIYKYDMYVHYARISVWTKSMKRLQKEVEILLIACSKFACKKLSKLDLDSH